MTVSEKWTLPAGILGLVAILVVILPMQVARLNWLYQEEQAVIDYICMYGFEWNLEYDWLGRIRKLESRTPTVYNAHMAPAIAKLSYVEVLDFHGSSDLNDFSLEYFSKLPRLRSLNVENTRVTSEGVAAFRKQAPGCDIRVTEGLLGAEKGISGSGGN